MPWYVLYTNPKAEKKVAEQLTKIGIETYCPLITKVQQWSDRKKKIEVPLFSSYVFVNIDEHKRDAVFAVKGVVRYLFWLGKPGIVLNEEILQIQKMLLQSPIDVEVTALQPGSSLLIVDGPFKNHSGIVEEINKKTIRLVLQSIGVILSIKHPVQ